MDKTLAKKAAVIATAAEKSGGMFVFATLDSNLLEAANASAVISKFKYLEHSCTDCGTQFAAPEIAGMSYHCSACGSGRVEASTKVVKPVIASDDSLSLVHCNSCGTHNVLPQGVVASTNQLSCTACGHSMSYKTQTADVLDDVDLDGEVLDLDDTTDGFDELDDVNIEDDTLFDDVTAADDGQDMPTSDEGVDGNNNLVPSDQPIKMDPAVTPSVTKGLDQGADPPESRPVTVDLLSEFDSNKDSQLAPEGTQLSFLYIGKNMAIASGMTVIATLTPEQAGENAEMMHTQHFQIALAHSIETLGLKKAVETYGFEPATVTVNVEAEALKLATANVETAAKQVVAKINDLSADFQQSVDIAAAGMAANFWRNRHDPVKAALIGELSNIGVKNAGKLVDRIFASHGVQQMRDVLEIARDLATKDVEARNGLAQAMNLSKYVPTQSVRATAEDESDLERLDEDDLDEAEEATVTTIAHAVDPVIARSNETTQYRTSELRSLLGSKPLFQ